MNSPSSSNTLKTLEEIEMELSNIEEEIRLLDEEEEKEKAKVRMGGDGEVYRFYESLIRNLSVVALLLPQAEEVEFVENEVNNIYGGLPLDDLETPDDLNGVNIDVIMDNQELPPSLSSDDPDAPNAKDVSSASTLAREVDVAGEMALRALDVSFLLLEKVRIGS